jgi:hypothetical protein
MTDFEKLQYARARLGLARMMGDQAEVEKWREHVAYWEAAQQHVQPTAAGGEAVDENSESGG